MRVVLAVLGGLIGAALSGTSVTLGVLIGALLGYAIAEVNLLRAKVGKLERDVANLKRRLEDLSPPQAATSRESAAAASTPLPAPRVSPPAPAVPQSAPAASATRATKPPRSEIPLIAAIKRFFSGGNTLVQAGVVALGSCCIAGKDELSEGAHMPDSRERCLCKSP